MMPWQPVHICVFCAPAAASPAGALASAQAGAGSASIVASVARMLEVLSFDKFRLRWAPLPDRGAAENADNLGGRCTRGQITAFAVSARGDCVWTSPFSTHPHRVAPACAR